MRILEIVQRAGMRKAKYIKERIEFMNCWAYLLESIRGSMKTKNYGAAVPGIKLMHQMVIEPAASSPKRRTWVNHY